MRPMMVQRQVPDITEPFRRVLVYGSAGEAMMLLQQAGPVIGGEGVVRLVEPPGAASDPEPLARLLGRLSARGVRISRERTPTTDARSFLDTIRRDGPDLVLKAIARAPDGPGMKIGRFDRALIDRCPYPLWLGDVSSDHPPRRVVAAVDPGPQDPVAWELSREVVTAADTVAQRAGSALRVLHAWVPFGAHLLRNRVTPEEYAAYVDDAGRAAHTAVDALLSSISPGVPLRRDDVQVVPGEMYEELSRFAAAHRIDLVVIGTRGRRNRFTSAVVTPHVRQLLDRAACSVLVLRR